MTDNSAVDDLIETLAERQGFSFAEIEETIVGQIDFHDMSKEDALLAVETAYKVGVCDYKPQDFFCFQEVNND